MKYCNKHFGMYDEQVGCAYCPAVSVQDSFELLIRSYEEKARTSLPWARMKLSFQFIYQGNPVGVSVLASRIIEGTALVWEGELRYVGMVDGWVLQDGAIYLRDYVIKQGYIQPRSLSNSDKINLVYKLTV